MLRVLCLSLLLLPGVARADLDVVFVLDTTGSMSGELREAKARVFELAAALRAARPNARVRLGVVAFRDVGDDYVTTKHPLTDGVDAVFAHLSALTADGGGDAPEDVLAGLTVALREMEWSQSAERHIFLIGDAPPQLDYAKNPSPDAVFEEARRRRVVIDAIGCRSLPEDGVAFFRRAAHATEGQYQHIGRVSAEPELAKAMLSALTPPRGERVEAKPLGAAPLALSGVFAAEARPVEGGCRFELSVPEGLALDGEPRFSRTEGALVAKLALRRGAGERRFYLVDRACEARAELELGGVK